MAKKIITLRAIHGFEKRTKGESINDILKDVKISRRNLKKASFQKRFLEIEEKKIPTLRKRLRRSKKDEIIRIL